ncbi:MAG TPA: erythromycin esterase family protein [Phycisphaerales bacterium]|nr:erythromycin esterase family protein [Phycisphaerales bacterium]
MVALGGTAWDVVGAVKRELVELDGEHDLGPIPEWIGNARIVLMGEATHGTQEFYAYRAALSKHLITRHGFNAFAVEADWPDAYRVNRFIRGASSDQHAIDALGDFRRFPMWMWRNDQVLDLIGWLREHNDELPPQRRVGFYGLDLYSLHASMNAVVRYLESIDPDAAKRARQRYACFDQFGEEPSNYGRGTLFGAGEKCDQEVVAQLMELREDAAKLIHRDGPAAEDELFFAQQNALVAANAERYYRVMFSGRVSSWNLRDQHMAQTLDALVSHLSRRGERAKVIVWAHNSHLGDARATEMGEDGELNLGQLARQRYGDQCFALGFSTYDGTVTAAHEWDGPHLRRHVRPGLPGSYEDAFHQTGTRHFALRLQGDESRAELRHRLLQRAIGVIYKPETERRSHYFHAVLADQFDAVVHLDHTRALEPLDQVSEWEHAEAETYPTGL